MYHGRHIVYYQLKTEDLLHTYVYPGTSYIMYVFKNFNSVSFFGGLGGEKNSNL